jgi:hypothetical protein
MAAGGTAVIPHEPFRHHTEQLLPARPLVLWSYTDMTDHRWTWGKELIHLMQDSNAKGPQKIGALNTPGWAAYVNAGQLFIKQFPSVPDADYPDFGCNCELFTNHRMLELESLSPLKTLNRGGAIDHEERWILVRDFRAGIGEELLSSSIGSLVKQFT